jgi:hypothetical protein
MLDITSQVQPNGSDIRVTKADGVTDVPFEIENLTLGAGGKLHIWILAENVDVNSAAAADDVNRGPRLPGPHQRDQLRIDYGPRAKGQSLEQSGYFALHQNGVAVTLFRTRSERVRRASPHAPRA